MKNEKFYAVIMAGGQGTRLWPLSRQKKPKQLQALASERPLICEAYLRLLPVFSPKEIIISTIPSFVEDIKEILPEIPEENYIVEPSLMGNAAACGLVTTVLNKRDPNSNAFFLGSDYVIKNETEFIEVVKFGKKILEENPEKIITLGITPDKPDVGLGYINLGREFVNEENRIAYEVKRFVEKPNKETAEEYLRSGEYLWNSGMFMWNTKNMLKLFEINLPTTAIALKRIGEAVGQDNEEEVLIEEYSKAEKTTIDFGIMEKTDEIVVVPANIGWSDAGSWESLHGVLSERTEKGLVSKGNHISIDDENCIIFAKDKLIATVGLKDVAIIDTDDAILICNKNESHKIKDLLNRFKEEGKEEFL